MILRMLTILLLAFGQNTSFTILSRSRNRSSFAYHLIAAVFSNGIFFITFRQLVLSEVTWQLFVPYTIGTVAGSLLGAKLSMWIEVRLGAASDKHLTQPLKESQNANGS